MKNTLFIFAVLFCTIILFIQNNKSSGHFIGHNPHDSLLFDGATQNVPVDKPCDDECFIEIRKIKGNVTGSVWVRVIERICGEIDTSCTTKKRQVKKGDLLKKGDTIRTGPNGFVQLSVGRVWKFPSGMGDIIQESTVKMGSNSTLIIGDCHLVSHVNLFNGKTYIDQVGESDKFDVKTEKAYISPNGTVYSVESGSNGDIVKVYEGSVEVKPDKNLYNGTVERGKAKERELKQLYEDFQNGRISMDEFKKKSEEISKEYESEIKDMKASVIVQAGYQVTIGEKFGEVIPIENDDNWWDDQNFK